MREIDRITPRRFVPNPAVPHRSQGDAAVVYTFNDPRHTGGHLRAAVGSRIALTPATPAEFH
jgi:hypothetical protein